MKKLCLLAALVLWSSSAYAQPRPMAATTLTVTNTSTEAIRVGCPVGSGTCTGGIVAGVVDTGLITSGGAIGIASSVPAVTTMKLYNNSGTLTWNGIALATGASLSGTAGKLAKFTASNAVGDSLLTETASTITLAGTMVATTFSGSGASLTALPAAQLTGTITSATQDLITRLGTVTVGVWNGTILGLAYGGAGVSLTGTGGTGQFLKQATAGATITVVRPTISDLSDNSNLALLNAANTFTAFGTHAFTAGGTGPNVLHIRNTTAGTGNSAVIYLGNDADAAAGQIEAMSSTFTTSGARVQDALGIYSDRVGGISLAARHASAGLRFYAGGSTLRWAINAAGDWTVGTSANIVDSVGTPTLASCSECGTSPTISGTDYAITITTGASGSITSGPFIDVAFGRSFATAPACTVSGNAQATTTQGFYVTTTTSNVTIQGAQLVTGSKKLYILCRGV